MVANDLWMDSADGETAWVGRSYDRMGCLLRHLDCNTLVKRVLDLGDSVRFADGDQWYLVATDGRIVAPSQKVGAWPPIHRFA